MKVKKIAFLEMSDAMSASKKYSGIGLGYLKSYIKNNIRDIDVKIFQDNIFNNLIKLNPEIIGISSVSYFYEDAIIYAKLLKKYLPNVKILIGGNHITVLPYDLKKVFDIGIIGEGEKTVLEVIKYFNGDLNIKIEDIKGIVYFKGKKIIKNNRRELINNVDDIPTIDRKDYMNEYYSYILTSRGCPYNCLYCGSNSFWGNNICRLHSAEYVVKDIKNLEQKLYNRIHIYDENFALSKERLIKIIKLWAKAKNPFKYTEFSCFIRPQYISNEMCSLYKVLNIKEFYLFLDSIDEKILTNNKNNYFNALRAVKTLKSWNFKINILFTVNNINETSESFKKTLKFIRENNDINFLIGQNPPFPGTIYWKKLLKPNNFSYQNLRFIDFYELKNKYSKPLGKNSFLEIEEFSSFILNNIKKNKRQNLLIKMYLLINKYVNKLNSKKIKKKAFKIMHNLGLRRRLDFPKEISIRITNQCNLNCFMCLNANYRKNRLEEKSFTYEDALKIVSELKEFKPKIYLSGGEPLLNKDLFRIIKLFRMNGLYVYIYTNGYFLEKYAQELVDSDINEVTISLDHFIADKHDKARGVSGSFDRAIIGINKLKSINKNIEINIASIISKENYLELLDFYDFIEAMGGISNWILHKTCFLNIDAFEKIKNKNNNFEKNASYYDGYNIKKKNYFKYEEIKELKSILKKILNKKSKYKTKVNYLNINNNFIFPYYLGTQPSKKSICKGVFEEMHIIGDQINTWCGFNIGDLSSKESLLDVWNSNKNSFFQNYILKKRVFANCYRCTRLKIHF